MRKDFVHGFVRLLIVLCMNHFSAVMFVCVSRKALVHSLISGFLVIKKNIHIFIYITFLKGWNNNW